MNDILDESLAPRRYSLLLLEAFSMLSLFLSALGIYGVVSYAALQRTREFGLRMALGATRNHVLITVVRQGLALTAAGIGLGAALALGATRLLNQLLFGVEPAGLSKLCCRRCGAGGNLICACIVPAWRASRLDPMVALRYE